MTWAYTGDQAALYLTWLRSFAVALIATHIRAIEAVADELLRATHLSGRRVREIIAAHPPGDRGRRHHRFG